MSLLVSDFGTEEAKTLTKFWFYRGVASSYVELVNLTNNDAKMGSAIHVSANASN